MFHYLCTVIFLLIPCISYAEATVFLKDGGRIDCESFWQEGNEVKIRIDKNTTMGFPKSDVDIKKTYKKKAEIKTANPQALQKQQVETIRNNYPTDPEIFLKMYGHLLKPRKGVLPYAPDECRKLTNEINIQLETLVTLVNHYIDEAKSKGYFEFKSRKDTSKDEYNYRKIIDYIKHGTDMLDKRNGITGLKMDRAALKDSIEAPERKRNAELRKAEHDRCIGSCSDLYKRAWSKCVEMCR
jgi:hypothetical protein